MELKILGVEMKHVLTALFAAHFALFLCLTSGCRREDNRELTVEIPSMTVADSNRVVLAFVLGDPRRSREAHFYDGIDPTSFRFDFAKKTLTMKYDSMKIAHTNIRMLLQEAGLEVVFPENNKSGVAGYLDVKPASVD